MYHTNPLKQRVNECSWSVRSSCSTSWLKDKHESGSLTSQHSSKYIWKIRSQNSLRLSKNKYLLLLFFQKVYFEMHSTLYDKQFVSTVRSCAWDCVPQNDFSNCSRDLYSSRGCIEKLCCNDNDLCNNSETNNVTNCPRLMGLFIFLTTIITVHVIK